MRKRKRRCPWNALCATKEDNIETRQNGSRIRYRTYIPKRKMGENVTYVVNGSRERSRAMRCGCDVKRWRPRRTREKGRAEENKRARVYIHVYVRRKPGREVFEGRAVATSGKQGGHRGTNTIKEAVARTKRTKSGVSVEREGKMKRGRQK